MRQPAAAGRPRCVSVTHPMCLGFAGVALMLAGSSFFIALRSLLATPNLTRRLALGVRAEVPLGSLVDGRHARTSVGKMLS